MNSFNLALILSLAPLNQITLMMLCHSTGDGATTQTLRLVYKLHITPINRCFINWILTLLRYKFNVVGYHTRIRKPDPRVTSSLIRTMLATRGGVIYVNLSTSAEVTLELRSHSSAFLAQCSSHVDDNGVTTKLHFSWALWVWLIWF